MAEETSEEAVREEPREEFFENEATDLEVEETEDGGGGAETKPWDPAKIRIGTKPFSLRQVIDMIEDGDIDLAPDFQRLYVWKPLQRSRLVESILLGIPLPAFYFTQDHEGLMQVVDGVQRLTTIYLFAKGRESLKKFENLRHSFAKESEALSNLEYLRHLEGKTFAGLDPALKRRFHQTQIFVNVIEPQTPDDVKFDVFRRINTGGSPLTTQEIRHCMSRAPSRALLKQLVESNNFHAATDNAFTKERRMADREVVLRFLAFRHLGDLDLYREFNSLDSFLLDFTRQIDGVHPTKPPISDEVRERLIADFDRAMRAAIAVFGTAAFRKYPAFATRRGPINRALFESWAVALADYEPEALVPHAPEILAAARKQMGEYRYNAATTQGTGDYSKVKLRFGVAKEILEKYAR